VRRWPSLLLVAWLAAAPGARAAEEIPLRREAGLRFAADEAFQARGGVQYWYALQDRVGLDLLDFDPDRSSRTAGHVLATRLVHTLDKDASFFTPERSIDLQYLNSVAQGYGITQPGPGRFRSARTPSNEFTVRFVPIEPAPATREPGVTQLIEVCHLGVPESVVVQHNQGFARVMGMRTAEASYTWTGHFRLAPGRTRVCVVSMSYVFTLPPFFLGGADRVLSESLRETVGMIRRLREIGS
jgi:hypothetical protein